MIDVVIPMTGIGQRFKDQGYRSPKPLIEVLGKPIIQWICSMFPENQNFVFLCRDEHLQTTEMAAILKKISPNAKIVSCEGHKLGPVYTILKCQNEISDENEIIVSYCDYYMHWNFQKFTNEIRLKKPDGAVPCYTGFHPHLIPQKNLYASCKVDSDFNLLEIREKFSYEADKTKALHSPGTYYFKSGRLLKRYCQKHFDSNEHLNGEFYMSLVYNELVKDKLHVYVPQNIPYFCQWGTPEDLNEFLIWNKIVDKKYLES